MSFGNSQKSHEAKSGEYRVTSWCCNKLFLTVLLVT